MVLKHLKPITKTEEKNILKYIKIENSYFNL